MWSTTDVEGASTFPLHNQPPNLENSKGIYRYFPFWHLIGWNVSGGVFFKIKIRGGALVQY